MKFTNRGKFAIMNSYFRNTGTPTNLYVALLTKQWEVNINNAAAVDKGGGLVGIPSTAHGFTAGEQIKIEDTTSYNGAFIVDPTTTANEIVITAAYIAEAFAGTETAHQMPGPDSNVMSDHVEIAAGNGYTAGGYQLNRDNVDFDVLTEDDATDQSLIQILDVVFTASGGNLPASGLGARYAVLTDDNATVSLREIIAYFDLTADRTVSDTQALTLQDMELRFNES